MGNVMVAAPKTDADRIRRVESKLAHQIQRIRTLMRRDDQQLARLHAQLNTAIEKNTKTKFAALEKKRIANEISLLIDGQEALGRCYEHVAQLTRVVRQLKTGRFTNDATRDVRLAIKGLQTSFEAARSDADISDLAREFEANLATAEQHRGDVGQMLSSTPQAVGEHVDGQHQQSVAREIIECAETEFEERRVHEAAERERRFQELSMRVTQGQRHMPAVIPVA